MKTVQNEAALERIKELMEKKLGVTEARKELSNIVEQVQYRGNSYVISRYGKPAAAVVPIEVYESWQRQREEFFELIRDLQREADLSPEEADRVAREAVTGVRGQS